jgi:hypothetical protein
MSQMSDWLEGQIRAHIFRTATFTKPTVIAIALCTALPDDTKTGATITEVTNANGYARQTLNPLDANWTAASATDGLTDNASAITFPTCTTATWGTVSHVAICDSATWGAGNMLFWGTLSVSKVVGVGDVFKFAIGDLDITFA